MEKNVKYLFLALFISLTISIFSVLFIGVLRQKEINPIAEQISLPSGFKISTFAHNLGRSFINIPGPNSGPRMMEFYNDVLFVSVPKLNGIVALPDKNKDGKADDYIKVIDGLENPHGIAFFNDWIYIANEDSLVRAKMNDDLSADTKTLEYLSGLPIGGHWTRTIRVKDDALYLSIGSSCNVCIEEDESRAAILKCTMDGKCKLFASGTRNAVGFVFHPQTNEIYATENSRDLLGDNIPPDEINIIKEGKHYGWPYCFGKNVPDPEFPNGNCNAREQSFVDLQAHSAPLGLAFNFGSNFPSQYGGDLFVAFHGSWNRKEKTGYKIVGIDLETKEVSDFATGWLTKNEEVLGRPVDVIFDKNGVMYVSDDNAGLIYRIWHEK